MNDSSFVRDLKEIFDENPQIHDIGGKVYSSVPLNAVEEKTKFAETITFNNLESIVTMIRAEGNRFESPMYVNVNDYKTVVVFGALNDKKERQVPYKCVSDGSNFKFGYEYGYEDFIISLRSMFVQNDDLTDLLMLLQKISNINSVETEDDGITQKVTASSGARLSTVFNAAPIRNLAPFRTFREINQPSSDFLFRIKNGDRFALYEADGGAWKLEAKQRITNYFRSVLSDEIEDGRIIVVG